MKNKMYIEKQLLGIYFDKIGEEVTVTYGDKKTKAKICEIEIDNQRRIKVTLDYELNDVTNEIFRNIHDCGPISCGYEIKE